ncbi:MAG: hypothetical protein AAFP26_11850 [Planctomycetota bacterium]
MPRDPFQGPFGDALRGVRVTQTRLRSASPAGVLIGIILFTAVGLVILPILLVALIGILAIALVGVLVGRVRGVFSRREAKSFHAHGRHNVRVIVKDGKA